MPEFKIPYKNATLLNDGWLFSDKETNKLPTLNKSYTSISLPHTWNNIDGITVSEYKRTGYWYKKELIFTTNQLKNRNYLRFGAAGQQAKVYVNGVLCTHHIGGYSAFTVELTKQIKEGKNTIDVWVSNKNNKMIAPGSADFNFYGGLYRSVYLIEAPKISISRNHLSGPGVRVWSENVSSEKSDINTTIQLDNGTSQEEKLKVVSSLYDNNNNLVSEKFESFKILANSVTPVTLKLPKVRKPSLWTPETPVLYTLKTRLFLNEKLIDNITVSHGFRWFKFTADKGFFLNGKPYKLTGINRHQDYGKKGNAVSLERHFKDISLIKEIGVNWLRLAHYQQDDYVLQLCDELGILVWEEIPYVNKSFEVPAFEKNLQSMLKDMIEQHYNHPSIILWGTGNEVWMADRGDGKSKNYDMIKRLHERIHTEDPVRKSVFVSGDTSKSSDRGVVQIVDVFGYNVYRGWYGGATHKDFTRRINELHQMDPNKPLILSEFGAGSDIRVHEEKTRKQDFSLEYQNEFLISHLEQLEKIKWLNGYNWWAFADFGAAHRGDTRPHINQKGLLTMDREKKDAFYILKSKLSKEPVIYIESPYYTVRSGNPNKKYKVFSNMESVEFFHNGKSLGKKTTDFTWNVNLTKGENSLKAIGANKGGIIKEHYFTISYEKNKAKYEITATNSEKGHEANLAIDGNPKTFWSSKKESELNINLGAIRLLDGVKILQKKGSHYLEIEGSKDGKNWKHLYSVKKKQKNQSKTFIFDDQYEIKYLKITAKMNEENEINNYYEIIPMISFNKKKKNLYEKIGAGE